MFRSLIFLVSSLLLLGCQPETKKTAEVSTPKPHVVVNLRTFEVRCQVHDCELLDGEPVKQSYGLQPYDPGLHDAMRNQFPNSYLLYDGGCSPPLVPTTVLVSYCPKCREAETAWKKADQDKRDKIQQQIYSATDKVAESGQFPDIKIGYLYFENLILLSGNVASNEKLSDLKILISQQAFDFPLKWDVKVAD